MNFLLVEDDPIAVTATERGFGTAPIQVRLQSVPNGIEACRYISGAAQYGDRQTHPVPDVIILDINLPRLSGFDFLRWLRESAPENCRSTPVIIVSSSGTASDAEWAQALGAKMLLLKPVRWPAFWQQLSESGLLKLNEVPAGN